MLLDLIIVLSYYIFVVAQRSNHACLQTLARILRTSRTLSLVISGSCILHAASGRSKVRRRRIHKRSGVQQCTDLHQMDQTMSKIIQGFAILVLYFLVVPVLVWAHLETHKRTEHQILMQGLKP